MSRNTILLQLVLDLRKKNLVFLDQQLENQTTWIFFSKYLSGHIILNSIMIFD